MENKNCIICLAKNDQHVRECDILRIDYQGQLETLKKRIKEIGFDGDMVTWAWGDSYPYSITQSAFGCCSFKPFCFQAAYDRGYRKILWMDSGAEIRDLDPVFERIDKIGYYVCKEIEKLGTFCRDSALKPLGITREESFELDSCWGAFLGFDFNRPECIEFLKRWKEHALNGVFVGPRWSGVRGYKFDPNVSTDKRVQGHRHDQTVASVVLKQLGMTDWLTIDEGSRYMTKYGRGV